LAPLASLSLAGQEHGRTIPLADIIRKATFGATARTTRQIGLLISF
jgi:hypothetical protein